MRPSFRIFTAAFIFIISLGFPLRAQESAVITWYGAAGQVSGSLAVVQVSSRTVMIDCGKFYAEEDDEREESGEKASAGEERSLPVPARSVDAVILTHAHLDHSGRLPLLVEKGFKGPVWCTKPTALFLGEILLSQAKYDPVVRTWVYSRRSIRAREGRPSYVTAHWRSDCPWRKNISPANIMQERGTLDQAERRIGTEISPCRACAELEIAPVLALLKPVAFDKDISLARNIVFRLYPTGHIPGAASILLTASGKNEKVRLFFSGDIGSRISALQQPAQPAPAADAVWVETTYGGVKRPDDIGPERERFRREVGEAVRGGGVAWIPAAALDRTQKILFELRLAQEEGFLPKDVPVICPSPTAKAFTGWYEDELLRPDTIPWFRKELYAPPRTLIPSGYTDVFRGTSKNVPVPGVMVTTSGMMDKAFSRSLLPRLLPDPKAAVFLTGYQAPGTPGSMLKAGRERVDFEGMSIGVKAAVHVYDIFSGHGDIEDVSNLLSRQPRDTMVLLVHGEPPLLARQKEELEQRGFLNVAVEEHGTERTIPFSRFDTPGEK